MKIIKNGNVALSSGAVYLLQVFQWVMSLFKSIGKL